jgi:hypothetical protein
MAERDIVHVDENLIAPINADQVWIGKDWARRLRLDPDPSNTATPILRVMSRQSGRSGPRC